MFLCDDEYEYLQSILMYGTGVIVTDSLTLSGMPVPGLEFGGSWEISPEDRAQVDRACLDWILLGISHNMDSPPPHLDE